MKTAVSIPDDVFTAAEKLARRLRLPRSRLYARALEEFLARHASRRTTDRLDAALDEIGDEDASFVREASRRTLRRTEW